MFWVIVSNILKYLPSISLVPKKQNMHVSRSVQAGRRRVRQNWVEFREVGKGLQPKVRMKGLLVDLKKSCQRTGTLSLWETLPALSEQELLQDRPWTIQSTSHL